MFCHAMPRAALFRRVSIRVRTAPASIPSPPLAAPSPSPRPPGRRLSQRAYHASPRVTPALPCAQGRRAVVAGGGGTAVAEDFDLPAIIFLRQSLRQRAAGGGPRTCHEMSCSVMRCHVFPPPRPSPTASPKTPQRESGLRPMPLACRPRPPSRCTRSSAAPTSSALSQRSRHPARCMTLPWCPHHLRLNEPRRAQRSYTTRRDTIDGGCLRPSSFSCDVMFFRRPAPLRLPRRSAASPSCMSSLHRVSLRSRRRRLACGATLFRA